MLDLEKNIMKI